MKKKRPARKIDWVKIWHTLLPDGSQYLYMDRITRGEIRRLVEAQLRRGNRLNGR